MTAEMINDLALIPALATGLVAVACLLAYVIGSRGAWRTSMLGFAFAGLIVAVLPVFAVVFARRIGGQYPGYEWVAWTGYTLSLILYVTMLVVIIREQRRGIARPPLPPLRKALTVSTNINPDTSISDAAQAVAAQYIPPVKANKAIVGTVVSTIGAVVTAVGAALVSAVADGVITGNEWVILIVAALGGAGLTGTATGVTVYATRNKPVE
jgi:hypothetical protein